MPADFDLEAPMDEILERCNPRHSMARFAVDDFLVGPREGSKLQLFAGDLTASDVVIAFGDIAPLSGGGGVYQYELGKDGAPVFAKSLLSVMS